MMHKNPASQSNNSQVKPNLKKHVPTSQLRHRKKLSDKYQLLCQNLLGLDPPAYLVDSFFKEKTATINLELLKCEDIAFAKIVFKLPLSKLSIVYPEEQKGRNMGRRIHETESFRQLLRNLASVVATNQIETLRSLIIERVPLTIEHLEILKPAIEKSTSLRELSISSCLLTEEHVECIKGPLSKNEHLMIIRLSGNRLRHIGATFGKLLSDHSARRDEIAWIASVRGEPIEQQMLSKGLCEINLQNNQLDDNAAVEMAAFLKDDQWSRCINLRNNKIGPQGVRSFAKLLKKNHAIVSLDLRGNPGLSQQLSAYIYRKLKENLESFREYKQNFRHSLQAGNSKQSRHSQSKYKKKGGPNILDMTDCKALDMTDRRRSLQGSKKLKLSHYPSCEFPNANKTLQRVAMNGKMFGSENSQCRKCMGKTFQLLKIEKKNLDLQLELRKLRRILWSKNIDVNISAIEHCHPEGNTANLHLGFENFNRMGAHTETDQQMVAKVQNIILELTRIMDNVEAQQITQMIHPEANLSNANSLSNTIPLFRKAEEEEQELEQALAQADREACENRTDLISPGLQQEIQQNNADFNGQK